MTAMSIPPTGLRCADFDIPVAVPFERRTSPDRRIVWRGGRRDTDWTDRPTGAWERFEHAQQQTVQRAWSIVPLLQTSRTKLSALALCAFAGQATVMGCSGGPVSPDSILPSAPPATVAASSLSAARTADSTHELLSGSFTLTFENGDYLAGTYEGLASISNPGPDTATLEFTITDGSGRFEGAEGTLTGEGRGAYSGEGEFRLAVRGTISTTQEPDGVDIHTNISGDATLSCESLIIVARLGGDGNVPRFGSATAELTHEVGGTSCEDE